MEARVQSKSQQDHGKLNIVLVDDISIYFSSQEIIRLLLLLTLCVFVKLTKSHLELKNLDLDKFQYFKYTTKLPSRPYNYVQQGELYSIRKRPESPKKLHDAFNRVTAVFNYFKHLFFGNPKHQEAMKIDFPPERAEKLKESFKKVHGEFGERLVNSLGSSN